MMTMLNSMTNEKMMDQLKKILLIAYVVLETLYKTIFGMYFQVGMERLQCVAGALLGVVLLLIFIKAEPSVKKEWMRANVFVFAYFVIRAVTFAYTGFQYTVVRSVFFEVIYLLVITHLVVDQGFCKKVLFRFLILSNLCLNVINTFFFMYCKNAFLQGTYATDGIFQFAASYTYFNASGTFINSSMYSNPNQIGLMTGIAVLLALGYLSKDMSHVKRVLFCLYFVFSLYCIWYSNCSSAQIGLILVLMAFGLVKLIKPLTGKRMVILCFAGAVAVTGCIYAFAASNEEYGAYTEAETKLNQYTTQRYTIWKDSYYSHQDELLLGCGNMTLEKRDRYQYNLDKGIDWGLDINSSLIDFVGPHNGYVGMISCAGLLGFLAFALAFLKKVKDAKALERGPWYLTVIFILVINLVECMMVISKNFCCLYLFLILAMGDEEAKDE